MNDSIEKELGAMREIVQVVKDLDPLSRRRVLQWALEACLYNPTKRKADDLNEGLNDEH